MFDSVKGAKEWLVLHLAVHEDFSSLNGMEDDLDRTSTAFNESWHNQSGDGILEDDLYFLLLWDS